MQKSLYLYCAVAGAVCAATARGDIVIEGRDAAGQASRVTIGADAARIDGPDAGLYMLLDLSSQRVLAVDVRDGFAMDLASPRPQRSEHAQTAAGGIAEPHVRLDDAGAGPDIAGYPTRRYRILVEDTYCRDEYLARAPLEAPGIRRFIELMAAASEDRDHRVLTLLTAPERLCEVADDLIDDHYPRLGLPLRSTDRDGGTIHDITHIRLDAPTRPALLELPGNYPVLTRAQVLERAGGGKPDAAEVADRARRIQERIEEIEGQGGRTEPSAPPP
ncbi:MAG: hypothetical protein IT489_06625 [Gammaproteobacteria bacterium]|nr:hypothetical protein [Gammaproteobacteria bacterium]